MIRNFRINPGQIFLDSGLRRNDEKRTKSAFCDRINFQVDDIKQNVYYHFMIKSFHCRETEKIFHRKFSKKFQRDIQDRAFMKLNAIDAAVNLEDLRLPPSNRLEALKGDREGQHSIRINDRWRVCFEWRNGNAEQVEIVDYH